ncbi:MAG TPA: vitamin K epoxide reductase family protein [Candidatus Saccharimonadales bacterium]|nr:vitamin K epoxide reductase family protein [Candidatus Saccharimonadales bacterium]
MKQHVSLEKILPWILVVAGVLGLLASFIILDDQMKLLANPGYKPSCSLNPVISCGSVMRSGEAHLFGFSNPFIGLATFPVLITTGVVLLMGAKLKRWFWLGLNAGALLGVVFVHWLFIASVYRIGALCPYCMVVWVLTITTFWYITLYNLGHDNISLHPSLHRVHKSIRRHHADILVAWLLLLGALIITHFWYFFGRSLH